MANERDLHKGDDVSWKSRNGETSGHVDKKLTSEAQIKGHKVKASKDNPQFVVESEKTGAKAAHKPQALHKK
jgi:hypothetical protein